MNEMEYLEQLRIYNELMDAGVSEEEYNCAVAYQKYYENKKRKEDAYNERHSM